MKVLIVNIDSKIPNLALAKIEKYHRGRGDEIFYDLPIYRDIVDKIYVSCVFSWNKFLAEQWNFEHTEIGGTGWDILKKLPPEIDKVKPRINIGFTTRGCIRKCKFCVVPKKEGHIYIEGDIYDIWDGKSKDIVLLDNNILALPEHFFFITDQIKKEKLRVDFNQGLDCRLMNEDIAKRLSEISHKEYKFAFDLVGVEPHVIKTINLLKKYGIKRCTWYVLVGFNTTPEQDLYRINLLCKLNQNVFVQRYNYKSNKKVKSNLFYTALSRWANQHHIFQGMDFKQFLNYPENRHYKDFCLKYDYPISLQDS